MFSFTLTGLIFFNFSHLLLKSRAMKARVKFCYNPVVKIFSFGHFFDKRIPLFLRFKIRLKIGQF